MEEEKKKMYWFSVHCRDCGTTYPFGTPHEHEVAMITGEDTLLCVSCGGQHTMARQTKSAVAYRDGKKSKRKKVKVILDRTWRRTQWWSRLRIVEEGGCRLRYSLDCDDSCVSQSSAHVAVWSAHGWLSVYQIEGYAMKTNTRRTKDVKPEAFDEDLGELQRVGRAVLGL